MCVVGRSFLVVPCSLLVVPCWLLVGVVNDGIIYREILYVHNVLFIWSVGRFGWSVDNRWMTSTGSGSGCSSGYLDLETRDSRRETKHHTSFTVEYSGDSRLETRDNSMDKFSILPSFISPRV